MRQNNFTFHTSTNSILSPIHAANLKGTLPFANPFQSIEFIYDFVHNLIFLKSKTKMLSSLICSLSLLSHSLSNAHTRPLVPALFTWCRVCSCAVQQMSAGVFKAYCFTIRNVIVAAIACLTVSIMRI